MRRALERMALGLPLRSASSLSLGQTVTLLLQGCRKQIPGPGTACGSPPQAWGSSAGLVPLTKAEPDMAQFELFSADQSLWCTASQDDSAPLSPGSSLPMFQNCTPLIPLPGPFYYLPPGILG